MSQPTEHSDAAIRRLRDRVALWIAPWLSVQNDLFYVYASEERDVAPQTLRLMRSTDGGLTWTELWEGGPLKWGFVQLLEREASGV